MNVTLVLLFEHQMHIHEPTAHLAPGLPGLGARFA
jgi:hypothetical protein